MAKTRHFLGGVKPRYIDIGRYAQQIYWNLQIRYDGVIVHALCRVISLSQYIQSTWLPSLPVFGSSLAVVAVIGK